MSLPKETAPCRLRLSHSAILCPITETSPRNSSPVVFIWAVRYTTASVMWRWSSTLSWVLGVHGSEVSCLGTGRLCWFSGAGLGRLELALMALVQPGLVIDGVDGDEGSCVRGHMDLWDISHVSIFSVINQLRLFLLSLFRGAQVIMCLGSRGCSFLNIHGAGCAAASAQRRHVLAQTCLPLKKEDECESYHMRLVMPRQPPAMQRKARSSC